MKKINKLVGMSLVIGLVITVIGGMRVNENIIGDLPNIQVITQPWLGTTYYGHILPWMKQAVYPGSVRDVIWQNFFVNILIWAGIVYVILIILKVPVQARRAGRAKAAAKKTPKKTGISRSSRRRSSRRRR